MEKARHLVVKIIDYLSPFAPKSRHHCTRRQRNNNIDWGIIEFGPNVILFMITWTHLSVQVYKCTYYTSCIRTTRKNIWTVPS